MANIYDLSDTWNAGATAFTAIKMNVTDTASAAASLLMDLQVGGVSLFSVGKGGIVTLPSSVNSTAPTLRVTGGGGSGFGSTNGFDWFYSRAGAVTAFFGFTRFCVGTGNITWASSPGGTADILLTRDAANTLAQRNGVNAQAFNLYNTYTDASNYERGFMKFVAGVFRVGTEKAGTGAATNGVLSGDGINVLTWGGFGGGFASVGCNLTSAAAGTYDLGAGNVGGAWRRLHLTQFVETFEMTAPAAPAANGVRIYAEDDGSGKTRLMARFATGAAQQIAIEP